MTEFLVIALWESTGERFADSYSAPDAQGAEALAIAEHGDDLQVAGVVALRDGRMIVEG